MITPSPLHPLTPSEQSVVSGQWSVVGIAATLVLLLDMQIETVATAINRYWVWLDSGPYYAVPTANFIAWWVVGGALALVVVWGLRQEPRTENREPRTENREPRVTDYGLRTTDYGHASRITFHVSRLQPLIPAALYLLSMAMFSVVNLARGYGVAGLVGVMILVVVALRAGWGRRAPAADRAARQISD